jgi:hypothetical protein
LAGLHIQIDVSPEILVPFLDKISLFPLVSILVSFKPDITIQSYSSTALSNRYERGLNDRRSASELGPAIPIVSRDGFLVSIKRFFIALTYDPSHELRIQSLAQAIIEGNRDLNCRAM